MSLYRAPRLLRLLQYASAGVAGAIGAIDFLGWQSGLLVLDGKIAAYDAMVPAAALSVILTALALAHRVARPERPLAVWGLSTAIAAIGILELIDLVVRLPVAPDRLFASAAEMTDALQSGRMSPLMALGLLLLAVALVMSLSERTMRRHGSQVIGLLVANLGLLVSIGYAYDSPTLYSAAPLFPALPAGVCLTLLGGAVATVTADRPPLAMFAGTSVRAQLLRAVLPIVLGSTVAFAALEVVDHRLMLTQAPMFAALILIVVLVAVWATVLRTASGIGTRVDLADAAQRDAARDLEEGNVKLERMVHDVAAAMGRVVEARDPYTQGHEQRVAALARLIAEDMGLTADEVEGIEMAGLLHDIGKLGVPAEILTKPGKLSDAEFALIHEHPRKGHEILKDIDFPWETAEVVLQHHERADGSGYPRGLAGEEILSAARILAVADVVEAMASHRPYRPALGIDCAMEELRSHPERYDPVVLERCFALHRAGRIVL